MGTGPTFSAASVAGAALMLASFAVPSPEPGEPKGCARWPALRDPRLQGMWLMALAGIAFGVVDVLAPLRLAHLGASRTTIAVTFLCAAIIESACRRSREGSATGSARGGRADRAGGGRLFGVLVSVPGSVPWLIAVLVLGMPFFGSLYTPAAAMVSESAEDQSSTTASHSRSAT